MLILDVERFVLDTLPPNRFTHLATVAAEGRFFVAILDNESALVYVEEYIGSKGTRSFIDGAELLQIDDTKLFNDLNDHLNKNGCLTHDWIRNLSNKIP